MTPLNKRMKDRARISLRALDDRSPKSVSIAGRVLAFSGHGSVTFSCKKSVPK